MADPILYSYRRCPYAMRGRMGLFVAGINVEVREISFRDKPRHMLEISPKGTVPVLQLADETVIDESLDVLKWALSQNDPMGWLSLSADQKAQTDQLISENDGDFKKHLDRYKYPDRYLEEFSDNENKEDFRSIHKRALLSYLKNLDARLQETKFLIKDQVTLADIALFPFLRQLSKVEPEWFESAGYDHLNKWLDGLMEAPFFTGIMKKYETWSEGADSQYLF